MAIDPSLITPSSASSIFVFFRFGAYSFWILLSGFSDKLLEVPILLSPRWMTECQAALSEWFGSCLSVIKLNEGGKVNYLQY
jgi:hypothetical protein